MTSKIYNIKKKSETEIWEQIPRKINKQIKGEWEWKR